MKGISGNVTKRDILLENCEGHIENCNITIRIGPDDLKANV